MLWVGGFRVLPSLGSCNKETLASRDCTLPTWRPSPGTLGRGEGNAESHGSWPQQDACQLSSRRRGAAWRPAGMRPLSLEAALQSLRQPALRGPGASARGETHLPFPAFPSLPAARAVSGPRVICSPEAFVGQAQRGCAAGSRLRCRCCFCFRLTPPPPASPGLWLDQPRVCSMWGGAPGSAGTGFRVMRPGPNPSSAV